LSMGKKLGYLSAKNDKYFLFYPIEKGGQVILPTLL
jgi:hypothetical protein